MDRRCRLNNWIGASVAFMTEGIGGPADAFGVR
jgi:hypothetical protein